MVLMRGLFGLRGSYLPTALNIAQCIGWTTVEVLVIAQFGSALTTHSLRWVFLVGAGIIATVLALRPLGAVRILRKYAVWLALAATIYLFVQVLRRPLPSFTRGGWSGFGTAVDLVIAHPRLVDSAGRRLLAAFEDAAGGLPRRLRAVSRRPAPSTSRWACSPSLRPFREAIRRRRCSPFRVAGHRRAGAGGGRDQGSLREPLLDRGLGAEPASRASIAGSWPGSSVSGATALGLLIDLTQYESYLYLIGSVFVPLFGVFAVQLLRARSAVCGTSPPSARGRWVMSASVARRLHLLPAGESGCGLVVEGHVAGVDPAVLAVGDASSRCWCQPSGRSWCGLLSRRRAGGRLRSESEPAAAR